jgi:16S rRNA (uracil1498-N3)-methyltransferase
MSAHRFTFYLPSLVADAASVSLVDDEHHHLSRVLRLDRNECIHVTNGRGLLVEAVLESVGKHKSEARIERVVRDGAPTRRVALALALLPRAHFDDAVARCVEVGATEILPVDAEKCRTHAWSASSSARVERVVIAAMKQSGRAWLPSIAPLLSVDALARDIAARRFDRAVVGDTDAAKLDATAAGGNVVAIVGPEAGFTEAETARLTAAGAERASLSDYRLRSETAAVVLVSALAR